MNMMSTDKENSSSVNIISAQEAIMRPPPKKEVKLKNELPIKSYPEEIDCEVILYVDNREKKN
jgi:hypothetical protein